MKLLWPALQLKATGQKSLIFVMGLFWVWCKQLRSLPYLPRVGLLAMSSTKRRKANPLSGFPSLVTGWHLFSVSLY